MTRVLVTGACGFISLFLCKELKRVDISLEDRINSTDDFSFSDESVVADITTPIENIKL